MAPRLLLLSNSTQSGGKYLEIWRQAITSFLEESNVKNVTFIPFAGVTIDWSDYVSRVQVALPDFKISSLHESTDMKETIGKAEAIFIGGGNTFNLLYTLQKFDLLDAIRVQVRAGAPYVGWSAGSNVATPDIGTTNDMPVIWPSTDRALSLVPFNINPHYNEWKPPHYQGEGRGDRLNEAVTVRKNAIVALSEATGILVEKEPPEYTVVRAPKNLLPDTTTLQVKVWLPTSGKENFKVVEVPLGACDTPVLLNPYLKE